MHTFIDKKVDKHQLILLNSDALYAQHLAAAQLDHYLNELNAGKSLITQTGRRANHAPIPVATTARVRA